MVLSSREKPILNSEIVYDDLNPADMCDQWF